MTLSGADLIVASILVLALGKFIAGRIPALARPNIPIAVTGGLICSAAVAVLDKGFGLFAGSVSFAGGHGTVIAWGQTAEQAGLPGAMGNMHALTSRFGPSTKAFLVVPLVGAFFIDISNAAIIKLFTSIPFLMKGLVAP